MTSLSLCNRPLGRAGDEARVPSPGTSNAIARNGPMHHVDAPTSRLSSEARNDLEFLTRLDFEVLAGGPNLVVQKKLEFDGFSG